MIKVEADFIPSFVGRVLVSHGVNCLTGWSYSNVKFIAVSTEKATDSRSFQCVIDRLKEQLGFGQDQQVAEFLGMSKAAFHARKARDSFPADRLRAAAARHSPPLVDADFVLNGAAKPAVAVPSPTGWKRGPYAPPINHQLLTACFIEVDRALKARGLVLDSEARGTLAGGLYELSFHAGTVNTLAVDPLISVVQQTRMQRGD